MQHALRVLLICVSLLGSFFFTCFAEAQPAPNPSFPPDVALIKKNGVLRIAFYDQNMPPFYMHDDQGNWSGIEVDMAQMIASTLGVKLQIVPSTTYNNIIDMLARGDADMGMGLLSVTPAREIRISFSDPYYSYRMHLLVNQLQAAQHGWNVWQVVAGMQSSKAQIKIGVLESSSSEPLMKEIFPNATLIEYPTVTEAMQDVIAGKLFAAVGNSPLQVQDFLAHHPQASIVGEDVEINTRNDLIAVALPWQYVHVREWLNSYLQHLVQTGIEAQLFKKYGQNVETPYDFNLL